MKVSAPLPTGVAALFFDSARRRRRLEADFATFLEAEGFEEVVLPVIDYLDPYEAILSTATRDELYRFVGRDGELLALRGDFTPMLARLIAPRLPALELPLRLYYRGDVLRYHGAQSGRAREFYQLGAEVLGLAGEAAEEEAFGRFLGLLERAELERPQVVLGFAGALDRLLAAAAEAGSESTGVEGRARELARAVVCRERGATRAASAALGQVVRDGVPADPAELGTGAAARLERLRELAGRLGERFPAIDLRIDLAEFADQVLDEGLRPHLGLAAYYDGLVFRAYGGEAARPLGGGGRYDRLFRGLGADVTAAGFSLSLDRLVEIEEGESEESVAAEAAG